MSEFLNNNQENNENSIFKGETKEYIEENSTIFTVKSTDNSPKKKTTGEGKKRVVLTIVSLVLAVTVGLGIFAIVKFIPDAEISSSSSGFGVPVVTFDDKTINTVTVKYDGMNSIFKRYEDESATSSSTKKYYWTVDGVDKKWTSSSSIEGYIKQFASLSALRSVELSSDVDYGFDKPQFIATVKTDDSKHDYVFTVGNQIATMGEYYVSLNDRYYVMPENSIKSLYAYSSDFANTTLFEPIDAEDLPNYYNQDVLSYFDYINVSGSNFDKDIRIICDKDDPSYNYYYMISPYNRFADPEFLDGFFSMFTDGLYASGIYSYSSTSDEIKKYGLDKPVAELISKIGNYMIKIRVGEQKDGYYPVLFGDNSPIYKMSANNDSMFFVESLVEEYVSVITIGDFITEISSFRFVFDNFDKTINLVHDKDDAAIWTASVNGEEINSTSVQNLYQHIILASPIITLFEAEKKDTVLKIVVSYVDGSPDKLLEFTLSDEGTRRYVSWVNGEAQGIVTKDRIDNIIENAQKVVNGELIKSPI